MFKTLNNSKSEIVNFVGKTKKQKKTDHAEITYVEQVKQASSLFGGMDFESGRPSVQPP